MRDLLFRNQTSEDKKRRILASSEVINQDGVHTVIRRHFICLIREAKDPQAKPEKPSIYILKMKDQKKQTEKFFCRLKGTFYISNNNKMFAVFYTHSLKISLTAISSLANCG
ncbi:MAG: hypothetical protein PHN57_08365 [Candidatus Omnitrophica bacterium]|nr:hypothetical protein [Candidatus Omnitrophota bacterium]